MGLAPMQSPPGSCTPQNQDAYCTKHHVPCCPGLQQVSIGGNFGGNYHYYQFYCQQYTCSVKLDLAICTPAGEDMYCSGPHKIACCAGATEQLVHLYGAKRKHYICIPNGCTCPPCYNGANLYDGQ